MENSSYKSVSLTAFAWIGFLFMIGGVVISIMGLIPDAPFQVEFDTFKMSTPQTGLVISFLGAAVGYFATKGTKNGAVVFSGGTSKEQKFNRNIKKVSIIVGVLAIVLLVVFYILNF